MIEEGWYRDPFGVHQDRWISDATPTSLVRDDGVESHDPPPDGEMALPLVPVDEEEVINGDDLKRADVEVVPPPNYILAAIGSTTSQPVGPVRR